MTYSGRLLTGALGLAAFLASIVAAARGHFIYPVELAILALLGMLLVASLAARQDDAVTSLISMLFFAACMANVAYLYSVAGYMNLARLGTLAIAAAGLAISGSGFVMQPVPSSLTTQARKLIAAETKLSEARQRLESVKEEMPESAKKRSRKAKTKSSRKKRGRK